MQRGHPSFLFWKHLDRQQGKLSEKAASVFHWLYLKDSQFPSYALTMLFLERLRDIHAKTGCVVLCQNAVISVKVCLYSHKGSSDAAHWSRTAPKYVWCSVQLQGSCWLLESLQKNNSKALFQFYLLMDHTEYFWFILSKSSSSLLSKLTAE